MELGLNQKVALVHGAGGGLGGAIARALAAEGATVVVCDINEDSLRDTCRDIESAGGKAVGKQWDLAQIDRYEQSHREVVETVGSIDILCNNTGGPPPSLVQNVERDVWLRHFSEMVLSVVTMTDLVLPGMKARNWGRIITSASSGVVAPIANLGLSNSLRSALVGWSKTLAREVGPDGVTSNVLVPGRIATRRIVALDQAKAARENRSYDSVVQESVGAIPVKRYGDPAEYGAAAAFLASRQASYITGSIIRVDGGLIANV
ncbi:SDR family oxidoreductase [Pollutimonas bauzanensis]|uniref:3-oxoacyl-[acyl-carrier protein] reductase n=1 Tax=Pollutimonas bauzanensis TaxID=658167 RepID=A0A1M5Q6A9_9BURK|nr:SDR family oxidoreductase [Pollutimonas bauzanensis]SHH09430.1 3-oxoacyl-[acyl-carrier protein] reductase [Pollutimonas bauzanensis]